MSKRLFADIRVPIEQDNPSIMRHEERRVKRSQCKQVCRDMIGVGDHYQIWKTGDAAICIHCGQCANVCSVDCITEVPEWQKVQEAIDDRDNIVTFSTFPFVRVTLGESLEMGPGSFVQDKMVTLLRALGTDYVLDIDFSAGLTTMEEADELIHRIQNDNIPIPRLTSCCPAQVKFVETLYPGFKEGLSTSESSIDMQGPTIKTYFAKKQGLDPRRIVNMAMMPYTTKKFEIRREEMRDVGRELGIPGMRDMNYMITTRELAKWARPRGTDFTGLKLERYDSLVGKASGVDVVFGNTGGAMEAVVRTAYTVLTGESVPENLLKLKTIRGMERIREASLIINGIKLDIAMVYGTANAGILLNEIKAGEKFYQFIEVMTCPGGCIGDGGQPKNTLTDGDGIRRKRISSLYQEDKSIKLRLSHEDPEITQVYDEFYETSGGEKAEHMLYTAYIDRSGDLNQQ